MTALPHPANVSQNVPMASAAYFFVSMVVSPDCCCRVAQNSGNSLDLGTQLPKSGPNEDSFAAFHGFN
jgi:hypothetical protein